MKHLDIMIDMDDTIECLLVAWVHWINDRYGTHVDPDTITQWDIGAYFPSLTTDQIFGVLEEDAFWDTVKPMPGALEVIQWMKSRGHRVYIATTSGYKTIRSKMERVLFRYFPCISWSDVIITSHKQLLRCDVLIDDGPHNLEDGLYIRVLMDAGHNRSLDASSMGMHRVRNWDEVKSAIQGIELSYELRQSMHEYVHDCYSDPARYVRDRLGFQPDPIQEEVMRARVRYLGF